MPARFNLKSFCWTKLAKLFTHVRTTTHKGLPIIPYPHPQHSRRVPSPSLLPHTTPSLDNLFIDLNCLRVGVRVCACVGVFGCSFGIELFSSWPSRSTVSLLHVTNFRVGDGGKHGCSKWLALACFPFPSFQCSYLWACFTRILDTGIIKYLEKFDELWGRIESWLFRGLAEVTEKTSGLFDFGTSLQCQLWAQLVLKPFEFWVFLFVTTGVPMP